MTTHITDKMINKLNVPEKGSRITYDTEIRGFGIRVTSTGQKSFIFNYTIFGRERRFTIGRYDEWNSTAARNKAKELRRIVDNGGDPQEQKMVERTATTMMELYNDYQKHHLFKLEPRHQKDVEAMWRDYILPSLGNKRLKDLTGKDIDELHNKISAVKAVRANRVVANLRSVLNLAMRWQLIEKNPAIGFKRNPEEHREIFLTKDQLVQVFIQLDAMPYPQAAKAIMVLIMTGARLNEVLKAEWDQFDLKEGRWVKPQNRVKQRKTHHVPIAPELVVLLTDMKKNNETPFLFPNPKTGMPLCNIKRAWAWLKEAANLDDKFRLHDLRHTFASLLISEGANLEIIGRLLGHTQAQTTLRYAHLMDNPLRQATGTISTILEQSKPKEVKAATTKYICIWPESVKIN